MSNRPHIGIFGRRNVGKSAIINALTGQQIAIVSDVSGTTTDPVKKIIELFGIGPVVLIDTAGIDDKGVLGALRIEKSKQIIEQIDVAILVIADNIFGDYEKELLSLFQQLSTPFIIVHNKSDKQKINTEISQQIKQRYNVDALDYTAIPASDNDAIISLLKEKIAATAWQKTSLLNGLIKSGDVVLLITPIDSEAPEGRLILPQVQTIRDILDNHCVAIVLKETEVENFLATTKIKPALAITDSQLFGKIDKLISPEIPLTGFSILLARHKGDFENYLKGTPTISRLQNGDRVLILESCTHQSSCDDIGRVKIPKWLQEFTEKKLKFEIVSGLSPLPRAASDYALVIQCGACMITQKQLQNRIKTFTEAGIPVTNYGMAIAYMKGIYNRAIEIFLLSSH